ncbi:hypothetical protein OSB04_008045 [Centaurea solstitialis]|uniref:Uncharacterized protein n=1 Tax=Centaurea solstitialis TaxID=347529 RepID=A0AA38TXN1_9ASTR|nr:hypothetical protein OSB04_008045 [Centaurea solstitialis]
MSFTAFDFLHQRFKRKLEDFDDDDLSSELTFVRMRKDDPNPNPNPNSPFPPPPPPPSLLLLPTTPSSPSILLSLSI